MGVRGGSGDVRACSLSWCSVIAVLAAAISSGVNTPRRTRKPLRSNMNLSWGERMSEEAADAMAR